MKRVSAALLIVAAFASGAGVSAPDTLRDRIIADARSLSPAALAFDRTTLGLQVGGGTRTVINRIERWDGKTWSLISVNGKPPSAALVREQARLTANLPVPGYHRLAFMLAAGTVRSTDEQGRTVLTIARLPANSIVNDGTDISDHLKAQAIIGTANGLPWVQRLTLTANEPFKLGWVLKVLTFEQVNEYQLDSSGKPRLATQANDSAGTMFGIAGGQKSEVTYAYR